MSSLSTQHPEDGLLLRYIDGELPGRKTRQVERHLEACWQCRTEIEELESTVADCVRYRKNVLVEQLPVPPNPWTDLHREFDRIDVSLARESWMAHVREFFTVRAVGRWAVPAVLLMLAAAGAFYQLRETPSVQAAALLKKAVVAADTQHSTARRIQVRTRTQQATRKIGDRAAAREDASLSPIRARFEGAHYDWDDPLSAKSYQSWRSSLSSKQDEVTTVPDPQTPALNCYQIRTVTQEGDLATASLLLRTADLHPVEGRLEFRDREWVELTELTEATTGNDGNGVVPNLEPPVRRAEPRRPAAVSPGNSASLSDELQVVAVLHEMGADLGDPVDVKLSEGQVLVAGVGISTERQKQIHGRLDGMPHVAVRFTEPATAPTVAIEPAPRDAAAGGVMQPDIQGRVQQQLGGQLEFEKFSSQVLDREESMMSRAYALRALAQKFSGETERDLSADDRRGLRDIARQHATTLERELAAMERSLKPVLATLGGSTATAPPVSETAWQGETEEILGASRRVEMLVSVLIGVTPGATGNDHVATDLSNALRELRGALDQCQRLLRQ